VGAVTPGDVAVFAGGPEVFASARVVYKMQKAALASHLWGTAPEGDTWEYIYFLDDLVDRNIPREAFNEAAGYSVLAPFRDVRLLSDERSAAVLEQFALDASPDVPEEIQDALTATELAAGRRVRGHPQRISAAQKRAIEMHAVTVATSHYESQDWNVEYVGDRRSYDLLCKRNGEVLHVEVKGMQSDGYRVVLTRNEEIHARQQYPYLSLFVVHGIKLRGSKSTRPVRRAPEARPNGMAPDSCG
jgi:hypothetical protein